jgi:hypothetical protein
MNSIMSNSPNRHPYIIVAPPYVRTSAGIKGMHLLAEHLHRKGEEVYIHARGTLPQRQAPPLTKRDLFKLNRTNIMPIVVYAETLWGNPLGANCVVRYIGNFLGKLGGPSQFPDSDFMVWHTENLKEGRPGIVLSIPVTDTNSFYPPTQKLDRDLTCFYAMKFKQAHGGKVEDHINLPEGCIEITRDQEGSQTPQEIGEIFRRSKVFYAFENTALSLEAMVCGCPVQLVPSPHFEAPILVEPFGLKGMAWGFGAGEWERAEQTLPEISASLAALDHQFLKQLDIFIEQTQAHAKRTPAAAKLTWTHPYPKKTLLSHFLRVAMVFVGLFRQKGFKSLQAFTSQLLGAKSWKEIKQLLRRAELAPETFNKS